MKISRDETGASLIKKLSRVGYVQTRQKGSHIRLSRFDKNGDHHITIPNHDPIKIGLLAKIINDVANHLGLSRDELFRRMSE